MEPPSGYLLWHLLTDAFNAVTSGRPIEKAQRAVTVRAHFSHDGKGGLHPVKASVRWVDQAAFAQLEDQRVKATYAAILQLQKGKGHPPYMTTKHMRLGPIGLEYERLEHIIDQRAKRGQDLAACMRGMAECLVRGDLKVEPPGKDNRRPSTTPQIWATSGKHQVTLSPFYDNPALPTDTVPTWVVSGYEMEAARPTETAEAKSVVIEIQNDSEAK